MKTVKEVSRITGVSVRTLHHYDAIGLLKPTAVTEAGYRLYDDAALERMQSILLFRELQFPLKDIKRILDAPDFDPMTRPRPAGAPAGNAAGTSGAAHFPRPGNSTNRSIFYGLFQI